ncbi:MAG: hypothetical protein M0P11_07445 [Anaerolineaceae bacterium]|nr:hypothetical protein [Anaerolineaceae bacterium]
MKPRLPAVVAAVSGLAMLAAFFFQSVTSPYLGLVLNWAIIVSSMALLVAIASLAVTHIRFIIDGQKGFLYSIVLLVAFFSTLIIGWYRGLEDPQYLDWLRMILVPVETALMGLIALVLMSAAVKIFRVRGWSILTVSFALSALFFLFLNLGFLRHDANSTLTAVISTLQRLPLVGARGLLIGVGVGALLMALRVLFGQEVARE